MRHDCGEVSIPIVGRTVDLCLVDYAFSIVFPKGPNEPVDAQFRIEGEFSIIDSAGTWEFSPDMPRSCLGRALDLFGKVVREAIAFPDGSLMGSFTDGTELRVPPSQGYESWQFTDSANLYLVSLPSGGLG